MANLFDISNKYFTLLSTLEDTIETLEEDQDIEEVAENTIKHLEITREEANDKIEAYYYFIKQKEGDIQLLKDQQQRLADKVKNKENLIARLKNRVDNALRLFGEQTEKGNYKLKTNNLSVWNVFHKPVLLADDFYHKNYMNFKIKKSFNYNEITEIIEYMRKKDVTIDLDSTPNMKQIKEELKANVEIPGAKIDTNASYVRFK